MIDDIEGVGSDSFPVSDEPTLAVDDGPAEVAEAEAEVLELEEEAEAEPEKPKGKSVQERIDEITADKYAERRRAEAAEARLAALEAGTKPQAPAAEEEPNPLDYEFGEADPAYTRKLARYEARQEVRQELEQERQLRAAESANHAYAQHVAAAKAELPDYDEKVTQTANQWPCSREMAELIKSTPLGPKVAYHLATNRDDAIAVANLSPDQQKIAFGMMVAHVASQPAKPTNIATKSPEPAPARTKGGQFAAPSGLTDELSQGEWLRRRNAQLSTR